MPPGFRRHLVGKTLRNICCSDVTYTCFVGHFLKLIDLILFQKHGKYSPINSAHCAKLYPQNGDGIVTIDPVASLHPIYRGRKCAENNNKWHNKFIFLNCSQHFGNFKP